MAAIKRNFALSSGLGFSADTLYSISSVDSSSKSTGSIISQGGAGIAKSLSLGGNLQLFNGAFYTSFKSSATGNTVYTLPATTPAIGSSVLQSDSVGNLSWVPMVANSAQSGFIGLGNTTVGLGTTLGIVGTGISITYEGNNLKLRSAIAITSSYPSGALQGDLLWNDTEGSLKIYYDDGQNEGQWVDASLRWGSGQYVTFPALGTGTQYQVAYFASSGQTVTGDASFENNTSTGKVTISHATGSTSTSTGALVVTGGVGIGGSIFGGSTFSSADNIIINSAKEIRFNNSSNTKYTGFKSGSSSNNTTYTLPIDFPSIGSSVLQSDTSGILTWVPQSTATGGGAGTVNNGLVNSIPFYPSTGTAITGSNSFTNPGTGISILYSAQSNNSSTGALVVTGGVGIGQSVSIDGRLQLFNGSNYTSFLSGATGNTTYTLPASSPATGTSVLQSTSAGVMSWVPMTASGGLAVSGTSDGAIQFKSGSSLGATSSLLFDTSLLSLKLFGFPGGNVVSGSDAVLKLEGTLNSFNGSTNGTYFAANAPSSFTGDLINLQVNAVSRFKVDNTGIITLSSNTNSTSTTSGSLQVRGGVGITGTVFVGETLNASSSTASTSSTTGALVVTGGVGIGGNVNIGGNLVITQSTEKFLNYTTNIGSGTTVSLAVNTSGGIMYVNTGTVSGNWTLNLTGLATTNGFASSVTLIIAQGSTPYVPSTLSISGIGQTVNWQGGSLPSGNANKKDALNYSILSTGSGVTDYVIFGQLVSFG